MSQHLDSMPSRSELETVTTNLEKKALFIYLDSTCDTWAKVWEKINALNNAETAAFTAEGAAMSVITGGVRTSKVYGTISKRSPTEFNFTLHGNSDAVLFNGVATGVSSSSAGTYTESVFSKWFFTNTSGTSKTKEDAIHEFLGTIRAGMTSGEMANYAYYDGSTFYSGTIVKVSSKAYRGRMFANDGSSGFYISDNSDNSSTTITLFGDTPTFKAITFANPTTFTVANSSRIIIDVISTATNLDGTLYIYSTATGEMYCGKSASSGLTINTTTNKLTVSGGIGTMNCRIVMGDISISNS